MTLWPDCTDDTRQSHGATTNGHDGPIQGYTGYLTAPYHVPYHGDRMYRGYPRESREALIETVKRLNRLGYQIAIRANGDEAISDVLAAYREAQQDFPRADPRFRIEHAQMARADQLDAMQALGVSPSFFVSLRSTGATSTATSLWDRNAARASARWRRHGGAASASRFTSTHQ